MQRASDRFLTTVLMTDIVESTEHAAELGDAAWRDLIQLHHKLVREALRAHGGREIDTAGDGFFTIFDAPAGAVHCALDVAERVRQLGIEIRAGVHVGEVEQVAGKVGGLSVPITARIAGLAGPGEVLVSSTVRDLAAGAGLRFEDRGQHTLKGVPGEWRTYAASRTQAADALETTSELELANRRAAAVRRARSRPIWQRRPRLVATATLLLAVLAAAGGLFVWRPWQPPALGSIDEDAVGVVDIGRAEIVASVRVGSRPAAIAIGDDVAWVANTGSDTVSRVDIATRTVTREIDVGRDPSGIAVAGGSVWVANSAERSVTRINAATARVVDTIEVGNGPSAVAAADGSVWVAVARDSTIVAIDGASGKPGEPIPVPAGPVALAVHDSGVWVVSADVGVVTRLDRRTGITPVPPIPLSGRPVAITAGAGWIWVAAEDGTITRIDPAAHRVTGTLEVDGSPTAIAADDTSLWVSDRQGGVSRLDLADPTAEPRRLPTTSAPEAMAIAHGELWMTTRVSPIGHRGGTLRVIFARTQVEAPISNILDPAVAGPFNAALLQGDGLVGYRRVGGVAGSQLLPNLATAVPQPTEGGRVYAFQLRPNLAYSDGTPVRASDFRRAIERSFLVGSDGFALGNIFFTSVEGASGCATPDASPVGQCDLSSGIEADDPSGAVIVRLADPDPDFLAKLALSPAFPIPAGVPMNGLGEAGVPTTGPYIVAEVTEDQVRFTRNASFREWNAAVRPDGYPDEIVYRFLPLDVPPEQRIELVARGEADYTPLRGPNSLTPDLLAQVSRQYAGQVHPGPALLSIVVFDPTRPPFDDQRVRQAVGMALDRGALARVLGGPPAIAVSCQFLPPGWPGHRPYCPHTVNPDAGGRWHGPDLAAARRLVEDSGTRGAEVTVGPVRRANAQIRDDLGRVLEELGYRVSVDREVDDAYVSAALREGRVQVGVFNVLPDILAPSTFLRDFTCPALAPTGAPCDEAYDALFEEALTLQQTDAAAAAAKWAEVDRAAVDRAQWIALFTSGSDFFSERVGNVHFHPTQLVLLDQLWVQ